MIARSVKSLVTPSAMLALVAASSMATAEQPSVTMLDAPEITIASILNDLDGLATRMHGTYRVQTRPGLAPHALAAAKAFKRGQDYFNTKEYLSAIAEIKNFREFKQVPTNAEHLEGTLIEARSYDAINMPRQAIKAYMQYIAAATTSPQKNYSDILDALRRLVPLASQEALSGNADLGPLLASVTSIEFPEEKRAELSYLAARTASGSKKHADEADEWFNDSATTGNDANLRARSLYFQALQAIAAQDFAKAEGLFEACLKITEPAAAESRSFARLGLARLAMQQGKPERALTFYNEIDSEALSFKEATFESTYALIQSGDRKGAMERARIFLQKFPKDRQALQVKNLLGYLELSAGNLTAARRQIDDADRVYSDFEAWTNLAFSGKKIINQSVVDEAIARGDVLQQPPRLISEAQKQFRRIAEQITHLQNVRGDLKQFIFTIGRTNLAQLNPGLHQRGERLYGFVDEVLTLGHRLAATERYLYAKRLNALQLHTLKTSEAKRTQLLQPAAATSRARYQWAPWFNLAEINTTLAEKNSDLHKTRAHLSGLKLLAKQRPDLTVDVASLETRLNAMQQQISSTLLRSRSANTRAIASLSRHQTSKALLVQYVAALDDEATTLAKVRDEHANANSRMLAEDASKAWQRWQKVTQDVYQQFERLEADIRQRTNVLIEDVSNRIQQADALLARLNDQREDLENLLQNSAAVLLSEYRQDIQRQRARHMKWQADIDRLRADDGRSSSQDMTQKFEVERQMLQDNLSSFDRGGVAL